jgi:hypothetical protein
MTDRTDGPDLSARAREVIAAVEQLQTDRARLRSLLAEVANTAIDADPTVTPWSSCLLTSWPRSRRPSPHAPTTSAP